MRRALAAPFAPSRSPSPSLAPRVVPHRASTHLFLISPRSRQPPWRPHRSPRAHRASSDHRPPPAPSRVVVSLARAASMTARLSRANDDRALTLAVRGSHASRTTARRRVRRASSSRQNAARRATSSHARAHAAAARRGRKGAAGTDAAWAQRPPCVTGLLWRAHFRSAHLASLACPPRS